MNSENQPLITDTVPDNLSPEEEDDLKSGYTVEADTSPLRIQAPDRRLITQPYDLSVRTIVSQIEDHSLIVRPSYQRGYVWDDARASRLIESLLMNVPIPPCYFAEEENGVSTVIDGQQRLHSVWRFRYDNFRLRGLRALTEYNGKLFSQLGEREQRLILSRTIRCIVITQESHPEIRFEVFERLNTGSVQLTDQEIRNAIYRGAFIDLVKTLADQPRWLNVLSKSKLDKRMRDDELIIRFFAVHDNYLQYQAPLRMFLNDYTQLHRHLALEEQQRLTELFEQTVDKVIGVFENHAFRIYNSFTNTWESQINRALFDAVMIVFSKLPNDELVTNRVQIERQTIQLFQDAQFALFISRSTADRLNLLRRIRLFSLAMAEIGLDTGIHETIQL